MINIETPCATRPLPGNSNYIQIIDRLGDVLALCNDPATADDIVAHLNSPVVEAEDVQSAVLEKSFT